MHVASPSIADALRLAEVAARLPDSDARSPDRVQLLTDLAAESGLGVSALTSVALRLTDWHAVYVSIGKAHGLGGSVIRSMPLRDLIAMIEPLV